LLPFLNSYFSAARADIGEGTMRALKQARKAHDGGREANIDDADGKTYANYIIPNDLSQPGPTIEQPPVWDTNFELTYVFGDDPYTRVTLPVQMIDL